MRYYQFDIDLSSDYNENKPAFIKVCLNAEAIQQADRYNPAVIPDWKGEGV